jgi:UDP-glucose 4-epimerase
VLERIRALGDGSVEFHRADLRDGPALATAFERHPVEAVTHFAGHKAVGESVAKPLEYYDNNIGGTFVLLNTMARFGVRRIVFSSSATVYGDPQHLPLTEDHPLGAVNPYGRTKQFIESILTDIATGTPGFRHAALRYFNPMGAHPSGRLGEDPRGIPNNLFPYITQVAVGRLQKLRVFGDDYDTVDGTGVRDFIHVMDLAEGHVAALRYLMEKDRSITANLGTGRGTWRAATRMFRALWRIWDGRHGSASRTCAATDRPGKAQTLKGIRTDVPGPRFGCSSITPISSGIRPGGNPLVHGYAREGGSPDNVRTSPRMRPRCAG